jgi:phospholipase C
VKPDCFVDGHPPSSKLDLFEAMLENIVDQMNGQKDTALFVAFDEGGGYWDSATISRSISLATGRASPLSWSRTTRSMGR